MTWQGLVEDERLPEMEKGDICRVDEVTIFQPCYLATPVFSVTVTCHPMTLY